MGDLEQAPSRSCIASVHDRIGDCLLKDLKQIGPEKTEDSKAAFIAYIPEPFVPEITDVL